MTINRSWETVKKLTYTSSVDQYGRRNTGTPTEADIEVVWKLYSQKNVSNPAYLEVEIECLTLDNTLTTENKIKKNNEIYNILFIIPGKYNQVFLRKANG